MNPTTLLCKVIIQYTIELHHYRAIKKYMEDNELGWMYKSELTLDFAYRVHSYLLSFGFKAKTPSAKAVQKEHQQ